MFLPHSRRIASPFVNLILIEFGSRSLCVSIYNSNCIKSFHYESMWSEFLWHKMGSCWQLRVKSVWNCFSARLIRLIHIRWGPHPITGNDIGLELWLFSSLADSISTCIMQQFLIMSHFSVVRLLWPARAHVNYFQVWEWECKFSFSILYLTFLTPILSYDYIIC